MINYPIFIPISKLPLTSDHNTSTPCLSPSGFFFFICKIPYIKDRGKYKENTRSSTQFFVSFHVPSHMFLQSFHAPKMFYKNPVLFYVSAAQRAQVHSFSINWVFLPLFFHGQQMLSSQHSFTKRGTFLWFLSIPPQILQRTNCFYDKNVFALDNLCQNNI